MVCRVLISVNFLFVGIVAVGQEPLSLPDAPSATQPQSGPSSLAQGTKQHEPSKNHIFWIIPNYRADENPEEIKPLTPEGKMKVAFDDSFDPSAFLVAGIFAGLSMVQKQYSSFGTGAPGFGKYYGGAFADQAIGNIMTEGLFPVALHQDPRYFCQRHGWILEARWICDKPRSDYSGRRRSQPLQHIRTGRKCCGRRHFQPLLSSCRSVIWKYRE